MSESLIADLRAAMLEQTSRIAPAAEGLRRIDYRPRSPRTRAAVALACMSGVLALAGLALSVVGLTSQTPNAFAGWIPIPTSATPGEAAAASARCERRLSNPLGLSNQPAAQSVRGQWRTVITDVRGPFTLTMFEAGHGQSETSCLSRAGSSLLFLNSTRLAAEPQAVPARRVAVESLSSSVLPARSGGQAFAQVVGHTGAAVRSVTLRLSGGARVAATVTGGWFLAWWPGHEHLVAARVTTSDEASAEMAIR